MSIQSASIGSEVQGECIQRLQVTAWQRRSLMTVPVCPRLPHSVRPWDRTMRSHAHAVRAPWRLAHIRSQSMGTNEETGENDSKLADLPPESLPPELNVVLQLAELVRLDRLVPRHDHLAHELPAEAFMRNSNRHTAERKRTHLPQLSKLCTPHSPLFSMLRNHVLPDALTCLLAMMSQVQNPVVRCGPARCMRVLPRKKPV